MRRLVPYSVCGQRSNETTRSLVEDQLGHETTRSLFWGPTKQRYYSLLSWGIAFVTINSLSRPAMCAGNLDIGYGAACSWTWGAKWSPRSWVGFVRCRSTHIRETSHRCYSRKVVTTSSECDSNNNKWDCYESSTNDETIEANDFNDYDHGDYNSLGASHDET